MLFAKNLAVDPQAMAVERLGFRMLALLGESNRQLIVIRRGI